MENSIGVVTCWYGVYPWYFPYFIHSCSYNSSIDFIIITDNEEVIDNKPKNVKVIHKSLSEIKSTASKKLGFEVSLDYAYKLCDFKPAYGFLFQDELKDYRFWGQADLDLILGNIRGFLTDDLLDQFDFINVRHDYTTGCFALYKNKEQMNTFFKRSKDYKMVFTNHKYVGFDECSFAFKELINGESIFDVPTKIESFTHLVKAAEKTKEINAHFDFIVIEGNPGNIIFDRGRVIYKKKFEAMLYHLVTFKKTCIPTKRSKRIPPYYAISSTRIYHSRSTVDLIV
jgi:hypothetical protein